jgi:hypothetical protein
MTTTGGMGSLDEVVRYARRRDGLRQHGPVVQHPFDLLPHGRAALTDPGVEIVWR